MKYFDTRPGYVYALSNSAMPHLVKIGYTGRNPETRAEELYNGYGSATPQTGVPGKFTVIRKWYIDNPAEKEIGIHERLNRYRYNKYREFFNRRALPELDAIMQGQQTEEEEFDNTLNDCWDRMDGKGIRSWIGGLKDSLWTIYRYSVKVANERLTEENEKAEAAKIREAAEAAEEMQEFMKEHAEKLAAFKKNKA